MISEKRGLVATKFGRRVSDLYIDPLTGVIMRDALHQPKEKESFALLHMIAHTPDMMTLQLRKKDYEEMFDIYHAHADELLIHKDEKYPLDEILSEIKTASLLMQWMEETPEGFPVAYEVYPGNTRDSATLGEFLDRIEKRYGKFRRTWFMDRGIPTEEMLEKMRERGIDYLAGTPKGHLTRAEKPLLEKAWIEARENVRVKILQQESEFYVSVESQYRVSKERSMRRRRFRRLCVGLRELRNRKAHTRDDLLMHIGALKKEAGRDFRLVTISIPKPQEPVNENTFQFSLDRERLMQAYRREGRYLLRSNMQATAPETVWENYLLLTRIEQAFKDLKGSVSIRPIWHQLERRIEAHIFVSFLAFCLHTTLRNLARGRAGGLTSEAILEKLSGIQMIDVHLSTTDGRHIVMSRYTQTEKDVLLLLVQLGLTLPEQPPPKVYASGQVGL